jgi:Transglycosylase
VRLGRAGLVLVCAPPLALAVWGWQVVHTPLAPIAARILSHVTGREAEVAGARLVGLGVELSEVRVGPLSARRVRVALDAVGSPRPRALLSGVELRGVGPVFSAGELALEAEKGHLRRAAFSGGQWGPLDGLAGAALREGDHMVVRAARPGLSLKGQLEGGRATARVELERLPLAGFSARGIDGGHATASGTIELEREAGRIDARVQLELDELAIDHPAVAGRRLEHLSPRIDGEVRFEDGALSTEALRVALGPLALTLSGEGASDDFDVAAEVAPLGCADALTALRPALPALDGLLVDGTLGGRAHLAGRSDALADLQLDLDLDVGCRVLKDAPLADVRALAGAQPWRTPWKPLSSLPLAVVRAFVASEDGRFFRHHGFDAEMIRRALAHDLGQRRIEKGASTITQQLIKNVFLSGERTFARKLEEAVLTWRAEEVLEKRRILELYLNLVELGPGVFGISEGAERYFGKLPEELSADEGAQLAALLPAPRRGMDAAWQKRLDALRTRLPFEKVEMDLGPPKKAVQLTKR